jgi:hypothetical protein
MAITSVRKAKEAAWFDCPSVGFTDERHRIRPSTHDAMTAVRARSMRWSRNGARHAPGTRVCPAGHR